MRLRTAAALVLVVSSCVPYVRADAGTSDVPMVSGRFGALWDRDLAGFEQRIAVERHSGSVDAWTHVSQAWLNLANCEDIDRTIVPDEPLAAWLFSALIAEETRRALALYEATEDRSKALDAALYIDIAMPKFFARDADELPDDLIQWPPAEEGWVDEIPARVPVYGECESLRARVMDTPLRRDDEHSPKRKFRDWYREYDESLERMAYAYETVPVVERSGAVALVAWRTDLWGLVLAHRIASDSEEASARFAASTRAGTEGEVDRARAESLANRAVELRARVATEIEAVVNSTPTDAEPTESARARLLSASYLLVAGDTERALRRLSEARELGLDPENFWSARYLELRVASEAADWRVAAALADGLPPRTSPVHGAYFYRIAVAMKRLQQTDRFLNTAMKAFRDRPYKQDPFLRALYWEALQTLADATFDERTVELLEEMGHRGDTTERVEEYARTALDRGQAANAEAAARWLLARHQDSRAHPRYHGIIALAAFIDDDTDRFETAVQDVARRPAAVTEAVPERRQSQFFAHADTELARVLRQMLPAMAEWGDDATARSRRQRWLRVIVKHAQQFVRETENTLARPQLVELYRLASGLLDDHPRGYAERVGKEEPAPLVLGTVRVEGRDLGEFEPKVDLTTQAPYSLVLIPRDAMAPAQWPTRWPEEEE